MSRIFVSFLVTLILGACGGGSALTSAGSPTTAVAMAQEWYDPASKSELKAEGPVLLDANGASTGIRHGAWTTYFPAKDGGGIHLEQTWVDGTWDQARPWREANADGSLRDTWEDE